jgi:hypothetical protein
MFSLTAGEVATSTCLVSAKPKLHGRDQRVSAGKELCLLLPRKQARRLAYRRGAMKLEFVHDVAIPEFCASLYAPLLMALAPAAIAFTMLW